MSPLVCQLTWHSHLFCQAVDRLCVLFRLHRIEHSIDESQQRHGILQSGLQTRRRRIGCGVQEGWCRSDGRRCNRRIIVLHIELHQLRCALDGEWHATATAPTIHLRGRTVTTGQRGTADEEAGQRRRRHTHAPGICHVPHRVNRSLLLRSRCVRIDGVVRLRVESFLARTPFVPIAPRRDGVRGGGEFEECGHDDGWCARECAIVRIDRSVTAHHSAQKAVVSDRSLDRPSSCAYARRLPASIRRTLSPRHDGGDARVYAPHDDAIGSPRSAVRR
jgi:hypothetical protein